MSDNLIYRVENSGVRLRYQSYIIRIWCESKTCTRLVLLNYLGSTQPLKPLSDREKTFFMGMGL